MTEPSSVRELAFAVVQAYRYQRDMELERAVNRLAKALNAPDTEDTDDDHQ